MKKDFDKIWEEKTAKAMQRFILFTSCVLHMFSILHAYIFTVHGYSMNKCVFRNP